MTVSRCLRACAVTAIALWTGTWLLDIVLWVGWHDRWPPTWHQSLVGLAQAATVCAVLGVIVVGAAQAVTNAVVLNQERDDLMFRAGVAAERQRRRRLRSPSDETVVPFPRRVDAHGDPLYTSTGQLPPEEQRAEGSPDNEQQRGA